MLLLLLYCRAQISGRTGRRENSCRSLMVNFTLACRSSRPDPRPDPNLKPSPDTDTDPLGSRCSGAALQRIYFEVCMWWRCPKQEHATERPASRPTRPTTGSFFLPGGAALGSVTAVSDFTSNCFFFSFRFLSYLSFLFLLFFSGVLAFAYFGFCCRHINNA